MLRSLVPPLPPRLHACPCRAVYGFCLKRAVRDLPLSGPAVQRVWDYVNDTYVHRLIQSKTDGKLVEVRGTGCAPCLRLRCCPVRQHSACPIASRGPQAPRAWPSALHRSAGAPKQEGE